MLFIDYHSRVPIYEQIKEQVIMLINTGVYKPGDKLPSIRIYQMSLILMLIRLNVRSVSLSMTELHIRLRAGECL